MKKSTLTIVCLLALFIFSCKEKKEAPVERTQMQQVMDIHDEVMPKMGILGNLAKKMQRKADTTALGLKYTAAQQDLEAAHTEMMDWMSGFGERFDSSEIMKGKALTDQKQQWLNDEEEKVKALREHINSSIKNAEALLKEN
ncbi:hypothetical protein [Spongiimicrobium salis]|uniref:hypothetical protein n=1 Tax=Spongiimicrobium salis TaxID=1667022 RepID=UPI00374D4971